MNDEERCDRCGFKIYGKGHMMGGRLTCDECLSVLIRSKRARESVRSDRSYFVELDGVPRFDVEGDVLAEWLDQNRDIIKWRETGPLAQGSRVG